MNSIRNVVSLEKATNRYKTVNSNAQGTRRPERCREPRARHANRTRDTQQAEYPSRIQLFSLQRLQMAKIAPRAGRAHPIQPAGCVPNRECVPLRGTQFHKVAGNTKKPERGVNAGVRRAQRDRRRSPRRPRAVPGRNASFRSRRVAGEPNEVRRGLRSDATGAERKLNSGSAVQLRFRQGVLAPAFTWRSGRNRRQKNTPLSTGGFIRIQTWFS